ncbi:hypothetical protein KKF05_00980 [Patescibacteria group bacterium]|nr:hypothetical protein [Patescibacteria group bacterium]MBU1028786.1 hypothetical protein [Patescibacteria group bacterium]MBU1916176.1 hypothetical protein [Patescibacteria group bacterium]
MQILGIDFGTVLDGSGVRGFFGDGYPYHRYSRRFGLDFTGSTFVAKTASLIRRTGYLLYHQDGTTPLERFPKCIVIKPFQGLVLNAVGLSNPGIEKLLADGRWQARPEPFFISVIPIFDQPEWRLQEFVDLMRAIAMRRAEFRARFGLQINLSCANAGFDISQLIEEAQNLLAVASHFLPDVPLMPKFSVETPAELILPITADENCHALCVSNALRWGALHDRINWRELFGSDRSPLELYGGGALSGAPLLPLVIDWVTKARALGIHQPINAGGGVLSINDAQALFEAGADSIFFGSIAMLRPWRIKKLIGTVHSWSIH